MNATKESKTLTSEEIAQVRSLLQKEASRGQTFSASVAEAEARAAQKEPDPAIAANPPTDEEKAAQQAVDEAEAKYQTAVDELWKAQNPVLDESDQVFDGAFGFLRSSKRRTSVDPAEAKNSLDEARDILGRAKVRLSKLQQQRMDRTWRCLLYTSPSPRD